MLFDTIVSGLQSVFTHKWIENSADIFMILFAVNLVCLAAQAILSRKILLMRKPGVYFLCFWGYKAF